MTIALAVIFGFLFGFVLKKAGAANPQNIVGMLRLSNFHLPKAIMFAIGFSSLLLFILHAINLVPLAHFSIKSSYFGVIVGGLILGVGWAMGGFCPGTAVSAAGGGNKAGWVYIIGGLLGALIFTLVFAALENSFLFTQIGAGKSSIVNIGEHKSTPIAGKINPLLVAGPIAVVFMVAAFLMPKPIASQQADNKR